MTRMSRDEVDPKTRRVWSGFDYALQVWVRNGVVEPCAHPLRMRVHGPCCNQARYAGQSILTIAGAEERVAVEEPQDPDVLARVLNRRGYVVAGELDRLPPDLLVVITLEGGERLISPAARAASLAHAVGQAIAEVWVAAKELARLTQHSPHRKDEP